MSPLVLLDLARATDAERRWAGRLRLRDLHLPVAWGILWGAVQAASPIGFWWLSPAAVYGLELALIAGVYVGFAVADGRPKVIVVETVVAAAFLVAAAAGVAGPAWLLVVGLAAHGIKDAWQHRTGFVTTTRWWPPFCAAVDWVAASILLIAILAGAQFH